MSEAPGCSAHCSAERLKPKDLKLLFINAQGLTNNIGVLDSDLESLLALGEHVILFGDFNSKNTEWNCVSINKNGRVPVDLKNTLEFDVIAPLTPSHFPNEDRDMPDILDIALMRNVNLKLNCIETLQRLSSDHRLVLMRLEPTSNNRPRDKKITTNWKKVSIALEEIDTPALNKIPNDIESTNDIDNAIGTLTSHISKVVKNCSRKVPVNSDHLKLPASVLKPMRAKNAALRRVSNFPTPTNRSYARALQGKIRERVREVRNNNWSAVMEEIIPTHKAYWQVAKALKSDG
ncbi:RNA-directed DNA polymerase from mobile element jockey [Eumeta japonica]|uniref:RNA-directed DNA polymerase from mobile element jockey n=1 Tax=Eumeta variegata TaxID=151549 RepID=A0A4C1UX99_EUMVA|nr:RNA-directed DNA polymerase from mobile element jockey [Eumeta japonica]